MKDSYELTQERWFDLIAYLYEVMFWDKELHHIEIENVLEALRNHAPENDVSKFQNK